MASNSVVSLAERLKHRRGELGISQAQAARELDVARTAYRLWEMEAARPAPDRWRLIASWLGVSVTTMLLAEDLVSESEAALSNVVEANFGRTARDWDETAAAKEGDFFGQARALIADGADSGALDAEEAETLQLLFSRIEQEKAETVSVWEEAELRKSVPANERAPHAARQALAVVAEDVPSEALEKCQLLLSELVTNSVKHGPSGPSAKVGIFIRVERTVLRAEVSDASPHGVHAPTADEDGGYGFALLESLATQWGSSRDGPLNVTWFEVEMPLPGMAG